MKFIIFIADAIRHGNFPRVDQFEYSPEYGLYIYLGRELTVSEFNEASKRVFDPDFRNQGFLFRPQAVGPAVDAEIQAEADAAEAIRIANDAEAKQIAEAAAEAEAQRLADEAKAADSARIADEKAAEAELQRIADEAKAAEIAKAEAEAEITRLADEEKSKADSATDEKTDPTASKFRLEGKGIFVGEERVAGLFGEAKQLRVLAAHDDLRPEIEAWLLTLTPSDQ